MTRIPCGTCVAVVTLRTAAAVALLAHPAFAQKRVVLPVAVRSIVASRGDSVRAPVVASAPALHADTRSGTRASAPAPRLLSATSYVLSRLDDNVNRDTIGLTSMGVITGLGARLQTPGSRPWLVAEYDVAMHRYSATERFDRVSQRMRSTLAARLTRWWGMEVVTEGALKGSSEDRDVSDQLVLQPRMELKLGSARRLRLSATQRWRRFPTDTAQDAENRYATVEFRHRLADAGAFEAAARLEQNEARGARFDFRRITYSTGYSTPIGRRLLFQAEIQYRIQSYSGRTVEIEDVDVMRQDYRLQPAASLQFDLGLVDLELSYEPEWRRSNDPSKNVDQHVLLFGLRRNW